MSRWRLLRPLAVTLVVIGLLAGGVEGLRRSAPGGSLAGRTVEVEPLAVEGLPSCERILSPEALEAEAETEAQVEPGGRVASAQLIECPDAFDGQRVIYAGELIGNLLQRDGGAWVHVNDDAYALEVGPLSNHDALRGTNSGIAVWLPSRLTTRVSGVGGPERRGDIVHIEGVFERADPADGGGATIRADVLEVLRPSERLQDPLHVPQAVAAAVLAALAAGALIWERVRSTRR